MGSYQDVLDAISQASEWADPFELEAIASQLHADLVANEPEATTPYGKGFTAPVVMS